MKLLIVGIIALFLSVGIALVLQEDPGYVLLSINQWTIETSVAVLLVFTIVVFVLLYLAIRFLIRLLQAPSNAKAATQRYQARRSHSLLLKGLSELTEGHWKKAETALIKGAEHSNAPALHYAGAAQAAQRLGVDWRRDIYLGKGERLPPKDIMVIKLTQAELFLDKDQANEAKEVLLPLHQNNSRHPKVLELLARSYRKLGDWEKLKALLPDLGKSGMLDQTQYHQLQLEVYKALLIQASHSGNLNDLHTLWTKMPESLRTDESLLIAYAGHLRDHDAASEAESHMREALNRQWSDQLVVGYGEIGRGNLSSQLATAEGWLKEHDNNPYLLLTCGRLAKRSRQLDKARDYLERSIAIQPTPDAYQELGEVLEETGDKDNARQCYHTGLRLLSGQPEEKEGIAVLSATEGSEAATGENALMPRNPEHPLGAGDNHTLAKKTASS